MRWKQYNPNFEYEQEFFDAGWPWSGHRHFAYDLVYNIEPKMIVELGTHKGTSFFSFCQAIKDKKLSTKIFAVDTWEGDKQAGFYGDETYQSVQRVIKKHYSKVQTKLLRMKFDEAVRNFKDNSIDILHIDGLHTYEAVKHDFESWVDKVSDDGIILFHDTAVRKDDFGVFKFWEELKKQYSQAEFMHSYGLGILYKGRQFSDVELEKKWQSHYSCMNDEIKNEKINNLNLSLEQNEKILDQKEREIIVTRREKDDELSRVNGELFTIKTSKTWRLRNILARYNPITLTRRAVSLIRREGFWSMMEKVYYRAFYGRGFRRIIEEKNYNKKFIKVHENWNEEDIKKQIDTFKIKPKISVIVPVYNVEPHLLDQCIGSVCNQFYENWELCLHDDLSTSKETKNCLKKWQQKKNLKVKISFGKENQHISGASNEAIKMATGEYVALLDNDDELAPAALFEVVKLINNHPEAEVIYSDEDKLDDQGKRTRPFFKPEWSPEMLFSVNYINHLCVIRKSIGDKVGWFREGYEGSQDLDLFLRISNITKNFFHVPFILYHWREVDSSTAKDINNKKYCSVAGLKALDNYILHNGYNAKAYMNEYSTNYEVRFEVENNPKISIIIPFKDQVRLLKKCIDTIINRSIYENYEIILIDNNSTEKETADFLISVNNTKVKIFKYSKPFNFSRINNWSVKKASGDILLFLNNDTEVISPYWLGDMAGYAQRPEIGAVGAKLLFGNRTIQHAGVIVGIGGYADHIFSGKSECTATIFGLDSWTRNYLAVTAACMMIERKKFEKVGGFDEDFVVCGSDVELCLRFHKNGYRNVYLPFVKLYHHESKTRKDWVEQIDIDKSKEYYKEFIEKGDPYYNINLALDDTSGNELRAKKNV